MGVPDSGQPAPGAVRVTLGIATYNRDTYLAEAVASCLAQDYEDFELLLVEDGSTNARIGEILETFADPRLRVIRHERNRGIAASYNTIVREGRGELIAMLGDDDLCLPDRLSRQVAFFDAHPEIGVLHGDAIVIDAAGAVVEELAGVDRSPSEVRRTLMRRHNFIVDPTRMVHRRVYEAVGGYDSSFPLAQDFDFWLRASAHFVFRRCPGGPLIKLRRHGGNGSHESMRATEEDDVQRALLAEIERSGLPSLIPELDWSVIDRQAGERQALELLAHLMERRELPLKSLAAELHRRADALPKPRGRPSGGRGVLLVGDSWGGSGCSEALLRLPAKELARRGWQVSVLYSIADLSAAGSAGALVESEQDGVRLFGLHNRARRLMGADNPSREQQDPEIADAFAELLERVRPDAVHFHELRAFGGALLAQCAARGLPAFFTPHDHWILCPRTYLLDGAGVPRAGPGEGARCAACVGDGDPEAQRRRFELMRAHARGALQAILAPSHSLRQRFIAAGYPRQMIELLGQSAPHLRAIWDRAGSVDRAATGRPSPLRIAYLGGGEQREGLAFLIEAFKLCAAPVRLRLHCHAPRALADELVALERRGLVEICGPYAREQLAEILTEVDAAVAPARWEQCDMLPALECRAARLPLLVPALGGLGEVVEDGRDGLLYDPRSAAELAAKLDRLASEDGLVGRLSAAIAPPPSFAEHVDALERLYGGEPLELSASNDAETAVSAGSGAAGLMPSAVGPPGGAADPGQSDARRQLCILATPAWRGADRLDLLLAEWAACSAPGCGATLCLLADPEVDGSPQQLQERLLRSGADFDSAGDVSLLLEVQEGERDPRLHAATDAYVVLHDACAGHRRMALAAGSILLEPGGGALARLLASRAPSPVHQERLAAG